MKKLQKLMFGVMALSSVAVAQNNQNAGVDIRKFALESLHNKQDEHKNTFWHQLARECIAFEDWSEVEQKKIIFKQNNKNWLPNPLIENEEDMTARKIAKANYNRSGNPVCGLLRLHLQQIEFEFFNKMALKNNRAWNIAGQVIGLEFLEDKKK